MLYLDELQALIVGQIVKITTSRLNWAAQLTEAQQTAGKVYGLHPIAHLGWNESGVWVGPLAELGADVRLALTVSPLRHSSALMAEYNPAGLGDVTPLMIDLARKPVISFFDRPVRLTVAAALDTAARTAPHTMTSQDVHASAAAPSEGGPTGYV